ncbi:MAG: PilZ domain-containing protein [Desulfobacteraceae bacterium]|nr:PilZ domain-containing protein [Desulfobacteraceae bacterium]
MIIYETDNKREAFRYTPAPPDTMTIDFLDKSIDLIDISAGGVSFRDQGFAKGEQDKISLDLRDTDLKQSHVFSIAIRILDIDALEICHCIFENPSEEQVEAIHRFLLVKQKKEIQQRKEK